MKFIFGIILILAVQSVCFFLISGNNFLMVDEYYHYRQIISFINGQNILTEGLSIIPGYHAVIALVASFLRWNTLFQIRLIAYLFNLLSILIFYLVARVISGREAGIKTLEYSFFPIIFPFFPLVYTDIFSILIILSSLLFALKKQYFLSGVLGIGSLLIRQNNIVWLVFINLLTIKTAKSWRQSLVFIVGYLFFVIFLIENHGIAVGARQEQQLTLTHFGNLYFFLFASFILFLPLIIYRFFCGSRHISSLAYKIFLLARREGSASILLKRLLVVIIPNVSFHKFILAFRMRSSKISYCFAMIFSLVLPILIFFAVYLLTFENSHPWNQYTYFLRNRILILATASFWSKSIFFIPIVLAVLFFVTSKLEKRQYYLLYPFIFFYLLPLPLVEMRYYFLPFTLFILFRKMERLPMEYATVAFYLSASLFLFEGVWHFRFFL